MKQNYQFGAGVDPEAVAQKIQEDIDRQLKAELERLDRVGTFTGPTQAEKRALRDAWRKEERERARASQAPRVTMQQFLDACPLDDRLGKVFLHYSSTVAIELVDYQLVPVGPEPQPNDLALDRPLALTRAVALGDRDALRVDPRRPMWLRRVEAGPEQPNNGNRRNLNLYVSAVDRYEASAEVVKVPPPPAVRAADRIQYVSPDLMRVAQGDLTAEKGTLEGWQWVLVHLLHNPLPLLYVPQESMALREQWTELYARLVLGEE